MASATGVANVQGKNLLVEVVVEVPRGQSARQATDAALALRRANVPLPVDRA
jgi:hypothetical protein